MVNTFAPDARGYAASVYVLDSQRLGKNRVEGLQLLYANLGLSKDLTPKVSSWRNHAAARMWRGHDLALLEYVVTTCGVWQRRGLEVRGRAYSDTVALKAYRAWQHASVVSYREKDANEWRWLDIVGVYKQMIDLLEFLVSAPKDDVFRQPPRWTPPPPWWGDEEFHRSHRSNLRRKREDVYGALWPDVSDDLPYVWPVAKGAV